MNKLLTLAYKGERDYLHGSDFFNVLSEAAPEITGASQAFIDKLVFRRYARQACEFTSKLPSLESSIIGQVRFKSIDNKDHVNGWLAETDRPVNDRRPFDESLVLADTVLDIEKRTTRLPVRSIHTPIEDIIILTKHLNYSVSPLARGNWLFGQLDLQEPLSDDYQDLEVKMSNLITGKFSVNVILIDGRKIGAIRFIVGQP